MTTYLLLDVATAPLPNAADYLDGTVRAPSNYKDADKIASYIAEKESERLQMAATDLDLARLTGAVWCYGHTPQQVHLDVCHVERDERATLEALANAIRKTGVNLITFGGSSFDLPLVMRRARYLGVDFPALSTDRYRSPHLDLCELLSDRNPSRRRSLQFYVKRLGWDDLVKPLSGAEEARVPETGRWDDLAASLQHDVTATYRLACWLGLLAPARVAQQELVTA